LAAPFHTPTASRREVPVTTPQQIERCVATSALVATPEIAGQGNRLHRKLSSFGVLLLTLSCLSPVFSIYGIGSDVLLHAGTGAAGVFICGIGAALVWAVVYAELGSAYPYAGGDYVGVGSILGPWAGFASLAVWAVTLAPNTAFLAKTIAVYVGDLVPAASPTMITFGALGAAVAVALLAVRTSAFVIGIFLGIEMLAVLVLVGAGLWHPARSLTEVVLHPVTLSAAGTMVPVALGAMALAAVSAAFATAGGNQAISFGEELADPHRHMGRVILIAGLIGAFATSVPVIAVVIGAGDLPAMLSSPAPFSAFVASVAGPVAGHALSVGVILAIFNALIAQIMFSARMVFSFGRDAIFHPRVNASLASVHRASGAPRVATWVVGALAAACCLLDLHLLIVFIAGMTVYSLALVSFAVLVGRSRRLTGQPGYWRSMLYPLAPVLGLILAVVFAVADLLDADAGRPSLLLLGAMIGAALLWHHFVLSRRSGGWAPRLESIPPAAAD
jgi:amino acid transporter